MQLKRASARAADTIRKVHLREYNVESKRMRYTYIAAGREIWKCSWQMIVSPGVQSTEVRFHAHAARLIANIAYREDVKFASERKTSQ